jgi:hypothetical protein
MYVCCELSGRGLCVGLITRPDESYRVSCVVSVIVNTQQCRGQLGLLRHDKNEVILVHGYEHDTAHFGS